MELLFLMTWAVLSPSCSCTSEELMIIHAHQRNFCLFMQLLRAIIFLAQKKNTILLHAFAQFNTGCIYHACQ